MELRNFTAITILISLSVSLGAPALTAAQITNVIVSIDSALTYRLPPGFVGNIFENFIDTITTENFIDTVTHDDESVAGVLSAAKNASFISYDPDFLQIIGKTPSLKLITQREDPFAHEAGVWVPEKNQVWFTSLKVNKTSYLSILDLGTSEIFTPNTSIPLVAPNGGYYFNGTVYITSQGSATDAPCIYAIDPNNYETTVVVNSYFGLRINGPNDVCWVKRGKKRYMFFTDFEGSYIYAGGQLPVLPNAVWRYDPQDRSLVLVVELTFPNGVTVNGDMTKLYVTETPPVYRPGIRPIWYPAVYSFDLGEDLFPVNKSVLGIARHGSPDGVKVDDAGRIWTGEAEGIVVRNPSGKVIGVFNAETLLESQETPIANFAFAGDTLVILAAQRLWTLKLAQAVVSPGRYNI